MVGGGPALLKVTMFRCIRASVIFELGNNAGLPPMRYRYPQLGLTQGCRGRDAVNLSPPSIDGMSPACARYPHTCA